MERSGARVANSKRTMSDACRTCTRQRAARAAATRRPEGTPREGEERPKEAGGGGGHAIGARAWARGSSKETTPYPTSWSSRKPGRRARPGTPGWPPPARSPSTSRSRIPFTCDAGSAKWDEHEFAGCHKRRDAGARAWRKDSPRERRRPPVVLGRVRGRTRLNYIVVGPNERA